MENKNQSNFIQIILVILIVVFGAISAANQLFISKGTAIIPSEIQAQTFNTFPSMDTTLPKLQTNAVVSSVSEKQVGTEEFEVKVPILTYHHVRDVLLVADRSDIEFSVSPKSLEEQLSYLHDKGFQTLSLNDLAASFENREPLPPKSVILTFDDGFRDFYTNAFPLLKKYNMRAVSFYVVGYSKFPGYMDTQMLREIHNSGLVDVQAHSMSHLMLTKLTPEEQRSEIFESKRILEEILSKKVNYFAYPYGDFDQNIINLVREAGYKLAFGTLPGDILRKSDYLSLPRLAVTGFDDLKRFSQKLGVQTGDLLPRTSNTLPETQEKTTTTSAESKDL